MSDPVQQAVERVGGWRRLATLGMGVAAVALFAAVAKWATRPTWVPLASGLSIETTGPISDHLDQAGIPYQLERGGTEIAVAAPDLARARVALARDGLPQAGRPGLELFDKPSYAMTDFTQRINYRRALEGELERTIGKMRGIAGAQVHLALHETSSFRAAQQPAEASVVLKLNGSGAPSAEIVRGIAQLVASSVDGLESDRVTVVDDGGRLLSLPNESESSAALTSRQLAMQREMEEHLREKATDIVDQIVGRGNSRIEVAASVNFDRLERTTTKLDPQQQATSSEQKAEIIPGAQGGAASTNAATVYENSRSNESYSAAIGGIRRLTVAVLVNTQPRDSAVAGRTLDLPRIDTLVRHAVGYDSTRGDLVSVVGVPFATESAPVGAEVPTPPGLVERVRDNERLILNVAALALAFVIAFMALRSLKRLAPPATPAAPVVAAGAGTRTLDASTRPIVSPPDSRARVLAAVEQHPEAAAKLARAWLKES